MIVNDIVDIEIDRIIAQSGYSLPGDSQFTRRRSNLVDTSPSEEC